MPLPFRKTPSPTRPSFSRDFAGLKTLDHGVGPAITFTRGSNATYFDATGTLRFAPNNHIRNSEATGATVGVIGSGGVMPTNWTSSMPTGVSIEVAGTGTTGGFNYIDIKISGTNTSGSLGFANFGFESTAQVVASSGQTWTASAYVALTAGNFTNVNNPILQIVGRDPAIVETSSISLSTASSSLYRFAVTRTLSVGTTSRVWMRFDSTIDNATAIDLTLRIAAPQLEIGSTATEYNPTTGTAYFGPRFDHSGGSSLGLLIEEARTNSIRNSQAGGSTNGVIGSGGVAPTHWNWPGLFTVTSHGVVIELIGTGTESGLAYVDVKISGTPTGTEFVYINPDLLTQVSASNGQSWTFSSYVKLQSGQVTNTTIRNTVSGLTAAGAAISGQNNSFSFVPTSSALNTQRRSVSHPFTSASVERANGLISVAYTNGSQIGGSVDGITLRIAAPQLEQGAFATSYIPTTTAAATRSADSAVVTPISSFYNQAEGTLFAEYLGAKTATSSRVIVDIDDNTLGNRVSLVGNGSGLIPQASVTTAGSNVFNSTIGASPSASDIIKLIAGCKTNDFIACRNGSLGTDDTSGAMPSVLTHLYIGQFVSAHINGHIRKIAYWPRRLSNSLLQQLTT